MKYFIVAGEPSGDLHGANLVKALQLQDSQSSFTGTGGDLMQQAGVNLVMHYRQMAFMGFTEVLLNLKKILKNMRRCKEAILDYHPDVLILIDYPGFNMRLAKWAKHHGIKVIYYISPQVWAWKQSRVHSLKANTDRILTILPFETEFFKRFDVDTEFVGHPLLDAIEDREHVDPQPLFASLGLSSRPVILLLPGSRKQEISRMLPVMSRAAKPFSDRYQVVVAGAPGQSAETYTPYLDSSTSLVFGHTYDLMTAASAALVTSGTATLETALYGVPEVVCYKAGSVSYQIARKLIRVPYISLVNLIMQKEVVKELIQEKLTTANLQKELDKLLHDQDYRNKMKNNYNTLKEKLGGPGASLRAAHAICKTVTDGK